MEAAGIHTGFFPGAGDTESVAGEEYLDTSAPGIVAVVRDLTTEFRLPAGASWAPLLARWPAGERRADAAQRDRHGGRVVRALPLAGRLAARARRGRRAGRRRGRARARRPRGRPRYTAAADGGGVDGAPPPPWRRPPRPATPARCAPGPARELLTAGAARGVRGAPANVNTGIEWERRDTPGLLHCGVRAATRLSVRQPRRAHVDAVAAERDPLGLEQPPLALALGERAVRAHDPVPRDVVADGVAARCRRSAARPARRRRRCARSRAACCAPARARARRGSRRRCPWRQYPRPRPCPARTARTRSSRSTRRPASSARRSSRTGSPSARSARGRGRASARSRRSRSSSPRTARTRSTGSPAARTPRAALAGVLAPDALAAVRQVGDRRRARRRRRPHRRGLHPRGGRRDRRPLGLPGEHDGPRDRAGRDVGGLRARRTATSPSG